MISKKTLTFLKKLKENNNKAWFQDHKEEFDNEYVAFKVYVQELAEAIATFDPRVKQALGDKKTIKLFRIYRDVRFSKDKRPYKQNFGASIAPHGMSAGHAGYYLHIEPGNSFIAGGIHMPDPATLQRIREYIEKHEKGLRDILKQPAFTKTFGILADYDTLKTVPRGFAKDHPAADLLRHKSFLVSKDVSDSAVTAKNFTKEFVKVAKAIEPLNSYLAKAVK